MKQEIKSTKEDNNQLPTPKKRLPRKKKKLGNSGGKGG